MPMLPTGLQRHTESGTYYLRRRIPTDVLVCYPGKKEITFSLRTKDYRTAVERHRAEEARLTSEWEEKRQRQCNFAAVLALVCTFIVTADLQGFCHYLRFFL